MVRIETGLKKATFRLRWIG